MKIIGAIIAGGKSSRMGAGEKAFFELAGKSILSRVIDRFGPQTDQLVINANGSGRRFLEFDLMVVPDILKNLTTPLSGLHAALSFANEAKGDVLVTVPSDTPFLPSDLVARLTEKMMASGAAIASSGVQEHYIIGAWNTKLLDDLEHAIAKDGLFRVRDWAQRVSAQKVEWPIHPFDPYFNVNTPEDLRIAERIVSAA
jgi:molybdopterin-guanine dinucleotide biosynthesis protein A